MDSNDEKSYKNASVSKRYQNNNGSDDENEKNYKNATFSKKYQNKNNEDDEDKKYSKNGISIKTYNNPNDDEDIDENLNHYQNKVSLTNYTNNDDDIDANSRNIKTNMRIYKNNTDIDEFSRNMKTSMRKYQNNNDIDDNSRNIKTSMKKYQNNNDIDEATNHLNAISFKNYNNSHIEQKLSNIERMKAELKNENLNVNKEMKKHRKRYKSILLTNNKDPFGFSNKNGILKKNKKKAKKRMSIIDIVKKRGLYNSGDYEIMDNDTDKKKTVKFKLLNMNEPKRFKTVDDNDDDNDDNDDNEDNKDIKENDDGIKYIIFDSKDDFKKENWDLAPSKTNSLFIKAVKKSEDSKNRNNRVFSNVDEQNRKKNKAFGGQIYKRKGENQKIEKNIKYSGNNRKYVNNNEESDEISSPINPEINNDSKQNTKQTITELLHTANEIYDKGSKKNNNEIFQEIYSDNDINEVNQNNEKNENDYSKNNNFVRKENRFNTIDARTKGQNGVITLDKYYNKYNFDNFYKRNNKRLYTIRGRRLDEFKDFLLEEDSYKAASRIKFKKAKIRKFKSHRYETEKEPTYTRKKNGSSSLNKRRSNKDNKIFNFENNNIKIKHYLSGRKEISNNSLKKNTKKYLNMNSNSMDSDEENIDNKHYKALSATRDINRNRKLESSTPNNNQNNSFKSKNKKQNQIKKGTTISTHSFKKRKINIIINKKLQEKLPTLNNTQSRLNKKLGFQEPHKKSNSLSRNGPRHLQIDNIPVAQKSNNITKVKEMDGIDNIKSKFKKRLIEIDNKLIDAIYYYKGPIDISCICPTINYVEAINELSKKMTKSGFKFINYKTNFFKFSNGLDSLLIEIVKIKNNMLYYLLVKNQ